MVSCAPTTYSPPSTAVSRWSNRPERLLGELHRTIDPGGLVKCPCSPKTRQLHSFLKIKQAPNEMDRGCPLSSYIASTKKKWSKVFTAWLQIAFGWCLQIYEHSKLFHCLRFKFSGLDKISVFRCLLLIMFVEEILFVICARYWGVIQAESKIYCILEADLLLSVHQSSFNNKRAAQLQFCISNSCRIGLSSSPLSDGSPCN